MPGLFSSIAAKLSGGDDKLVNQIEEFASAFVTQGEVSRALALKREETALLDAILAEELYRAYCADKGKECNPKSAARLEEARKAREAQIQAQGEALARLEEAFRAVALDMVTLARQRGKFASGFASADGLTESMVSEAIAPRAAEVKAAKRALTH